MATVVATARPAPPRSPSKDSPAPRPSPTKRALSSPNSSPPLGSHEQESPRVLRTKLSSTINVLSAGDETTRSLEMRALLSQGDELGRGVPPTTATPPSPGAQGWTGLGVGLGSKDLEQTSEGATQTLVAEQQQRRLQAMPVELHHALARLSSQHHMSEYNLLKQRAAVQLQQPPYPPPIRTVPLQRSYSSPPIGSAAPARPPQVLAVPRPPPPPMPISIPPVPTSTRPTIARASTNWPSIFRPVYNLAVSVTGTPDRSRSNTPPVVAEQRETTALTPTLANLAFDSSAPTPINGPHTPQVEAMPTQDIAEALGDALQSNLDRTAAIAEARKEPTPPLTTGFQPPPHAQSPIAVMSNGLLPGMKIINGVAVKTSVSHPMNISALVPPEYLPHFAQSMFASSTSPPAIAIKKSPLADSTSAHSNSSTPTGTLTPFLLDRPAVGDLWDLMATSFDPSPSSTSLPPPTVPTAKLGNFMLSSCPGKKVRMDGPQPKGGRSAICRDVSLDLGRAKEEGVGLVICCLDDSELSFLGAPWTEYSTAATALSLAVIRIPMVEGFAPSSPAALDAQLDRVIRDYTLKGRSVLAHCRGGIGRAGLVACCWMIKMGFVGAGAESEEGVGEATMKTVERVIDVIRKRRSVKSIETPVQVAFLLSYVAYLQEQATVLHAAELV